MTALQAGNVRVTAPDSSNLLLTSTDSIGTVSLVLGRNDNGSAKDRVNTTWEN
jgi:hypothetical protein